MTYEEFIELMRHTNQGKYVQRHHIIPLSQGGTDDMSNTIYLSWICHWYAHQLYTKETGIHTATSSISLDDWLLKSYRNGMKHYSEETKSRISESKKGQLKGSKWYNNGIRNVRAYECPEGFKEGRIISDEHREVIKHNSKIIGACVGFGSNNEPIPREKMKTVDENLKKRRRKNV